MNPNLPKTRSVKVLVEVSVPADYPKLTNDDADQFQDAISMLDEEYPGWVFSIDLVDIHTDTGPE